MADKLKLSVPGKPEYLGVVRLAVSSAANAAGFSMDAVEDITIAVSEVCTHIFCSSNSSSYEVSCEMSDQGMSISIDDLGGDESRDMHPCFCLPVTSYFPDVYDPSVSMILLNALMDEVDIFSCSGGDVMIRMRKEQEH
jgi:serine/threonine-protein kinase RsbW